MAALDPFANSHTPEAEDRFSFIHVDLNSFFASVEQQIHPEYRNRPIAVVPTFADTTVAIAASYEAKALGIKTGTRVSDMKKLCPGIILVQGDHTTYAEYSHRIHAAVERVCPVAHVPSIDEVACQLIGREQEPPRARQIALDIKQAIKDDVGETLRCSIGMAPNRYLAKIASDMQKPDGLIGLLPSQLPRALAQLDLRDLPGVGARTEQMLIGKGITTMPQLLALDREGMHKLWNSVWGDRLYHWLRGHSTGDDGAPISNEMQKSLGHSHVLGPQHRTLEGSWAVAHKLLHKAAMRLRMEKLRAGSLALTIRYQLTRDEVDIKTSTHDVSSRPERSEVEGSAFFEAPQNQARHVREALDSSFPTAAEQLTRSINELSSSSMDDLSSHNIRDLSSRSEAEGSAFLHPPPNQMHHQLAHTPPKGKAKVGSSFEEASFEAPQNRTPHQPALNPPKGEAKVVSTFEKDGAYGPSGKSAKIKQHQSGIKHEGWGMEARFPTCQDTLTLLETLSKLWSQRPIGPEHQRPFFVGVTLGRLINESEQQPTLFQDPDKREELSRTLDKLNLKYGHTTLHFAGMLPARDSAPTRIAFTQIPVQYGTDWM